MAKVDKSAVVEETAATEAPVEAKTPKAPINPQVPAEYKTDKGTYKPGHDAKHASDTAKAILAGGDEQELLAKLGSDNLREKAIKQVANAQAKYATQGTEGTAVIGKTEYDARKVRGSGDVRVDGDDGWVLYPADSEVAKTFESKADREKSKAEAEKANMADTEGE